MAVVPPVEEAEGFLKGIDISLPMVDGIILATAQAGGAVLWTQDEHFEGIEGVKYIEK